MKKTIMLLFLCSSLLASVPTPEGLLRNPNNKDITDNLIVVKFSTEKKKDDVLSVQEMVATEEMISQDEQISKKEMDKILYVKQIYVIDENKRVDLIQATYESGQMNNESLVNVVTRENILKNLGNEPSAEKGLFYSLMSMLTLNTSEVFMNYLKMNNVLLPSNNDLRNKEKVDLYAKYKTYLKLKKEDEESDIENPLSPTDEESKKIVKEVMDKPFFENTEIIKLTKEVSGYFWEIDKDGFWAKFENSSKRLNRIRLNKASNVIDISLDEFIVYDGKHEFPRFINYKTFTNEHYIVKTLAVDYFTSTSKNFKDRKEDYEKLLSKVKDSISNKPYTLVYPEFIIRE
ncbi:hypothetical protein OAT67_03595 [Bacteriovoracaceae bacterium]|nr:hypothetical protein [Bacteriovoracaceae bacterium]